MPLEFGDDFSTPYEPGARVWHKGNDPIRRHPIAIDDVYLPEIHPINMFGWYLTVPLTVSAAWTVLPLKIKS